MRNAAGGGESSAAPVLPASEAVGSIVLMNPSSFSFFVDGGRAQERVVGACAHDAAESCHQVGTGGAQLVVVMKSEFGQDLLSFRGEREQDLAAVVLGAGTMDKASGFQPVHQLDGAMVADLHAGGQFANPRPHPGRHALDRQHELILATLQPGLLHDLLAEVEEAADLVTELRQRLIVGQGKLLHAADWAMPRPGDTFTVYRKAI